MPAQEGKEVDCGATGGCGGIIARRARRVACGAHTSCWGKKRGLLRGDWGGWGDSGGAMRAAALERVRSEISQIGQEFLAETLVQGPKVRMSAWPFDVGVSIPRIASHVTEAEGFQRARQFRDTGD